jgi:nitroreductase
MTPAQVRRYRLIMETWDAIRARRNVRAFSEQEIEPADLDRVLEAGWRSPSGSNRQRWDFIVCTERAQLIELAKVWRGAGHVATSQATVALIAPTPTEDDARGGLQYDLGQATMSMMIAAADLGIGSAHAAVSEQDLARELLGFPDDHFCAWLIALGYPADRPLRPIAHPDRRPFDEVVHHDRW